MTYNAFIATRPRSRRQKDDSSATAGSAKISTITARSKSELKELGDRTKWTPGPRTMQEIQEMSSQRLLWEEAWNSEQFQATFQREAIGKHNDDAMKQWAVKRMWDGHATEEESQKAYAAGDKFASNYWDSWFSPTKLQELERKKR